MLNDINPIETGNGLKLNISENDNSLDLDLALEVAIFFRVNNKKAEQIIKDIKKIVSKWRKLASDFNISKTEQELMSNAFILTQ